jgi:purine/pyrimidine-nucleoside phosphorylase
MLTVNEYFDGKVKSIAFESEEGQATSGVMAVGEYEFSTSATEYMFVTSGKLIVKLPQHDNWSEFTKGQTFIVEAHQKFKVKVPVESSYVCFYK